MKMTKEQVIELLEGHDAIIGETIDGENMIIFRGWEDMGDLVMEYNHLRSKGVKKKLLKLGVTDVEGFLKRVADSGDTRVGRNGRACMDDNAPYTCIVPDLDDIIKEVFDGEYETGFDDEYDTCSECGKIVRTGPDSYSWTPDFEHTEDGLICKVCLAEDPESYIESIKNTARKGATDGMGIDITQHGWVKAGEDYEVGLYDHADDNPEKILEILNEADIDVIFKIFPSQFEVSFEVYVPEDKKDAAEKILSGGNTKYPVGESPAEMCKKGLAEATKKMNELPDGEGVKYAKVNADGTADVKVVSKKKFIDGVKDD